MPEISVIMGVYNCRDIDMLKKSVQSVINQTYRDWEFIICNDGSTNDTLTALENIAKMDNRIRIISYEKNKGLAYALNSCLKVAKGKYIARQDDDDFSCENRFQEQIDYLEKNRDFSFVGTAAYVYDGNGVWGEYKVKQFPNKKDFLWSNPFAHPTLMIRADVIKKCKGYRIAKETRRCEDYDLFMRLYSNGYIGMNMQDKLYYYRIENNNKKYRAFKYRVDEAVVRYKGYCKLKLFPLGFVYVLKPIMISFIPQRLFKKIRKKQY